MSATDSPAAAATPKLVAYHLPGAPRPPIRPAARARHWMGDTTDGFANRCLPLLDANDCGWFIENTHPFIAEWGGERQPESISIDWLDAPPPYPAVSHFGHGILTFPIPYLFRTSPGISLAVRGPANWPRDGIVALEGIVDADWAVAPFTMNWKFTAPDLPVRFDTGEPICMVAPVWRGLVSSLEPTLCELAQDEQLHEAHLAWSSQRAQFLDDLAAPGSAASRRGWQRDYVLGRLPDGTRAPRDPRHGRPQPFVDAPAPPLP